MTCIVGIEYNGKVFLGGDRCSSNEHIKTIVDRPKVFHNGPILVGYTDSFRIGDLLQYHLSPAKRPKILSDEEYVYMVLVEQIRELMKDKGFSMVSENAETGGNCLIGYKGKLYELQSDFSLNRTLSGYNAIGSGADYALGSLFATSDLSPEDRIFTALSAAANFSPGVSPPFDIIESKKKSK